jgi:hypothetical protein
VRDVVAHEVGHVLGLRHNFAGSLDATLTHKELDDFFSAYVAGKDLGSYAGKLTSSSMMEYNNFKASVFIGWRMRNMAEPLPHDRAAIQWGYFDSREAVTSRMLFATDQDAGRYGDVTTFDYGADPVVGAYGEMAAAIRNLPNTIIERYISARAPRDPKDRIPLEQVNLSVRGYAATVLGQWSRILPWFSSDTRSLRVENDFDFIGDLNRRERHQAHWAYLEKQMEMLGGVDRALFSVLPMDWKLELKKLPDSLMEADKVDAVKLTARLEKLLSAPGYTNFVGLDSKAYAFTPEEKELIVQRGRKLFQELEEEVLLQACRALENAKRDLAREANGVVSDTDLVAQVEKRMIELARRIVMAKDPDKRIKGMISRSYLEVVDFKYGVETRLAAVRMLKDGVGSFKGWAWDSKSDLNKALKAEVDTALNIPNLKEFREAMLSRPLRDWYLVQQEILQQLPVRPGTGAAPGNATPPATLETGE